MRDLLGQVLELLPDQALALARIVDRTGAGPRGTGASMVVTEDGHVLGSLSGGCVESAVLTTANQVLLDGHATLERFAAADELTVGLPCGGEIEVFVERLDHTDLPALRALHVALDAHRPVAYATTLESAPDRKLLYPGDRTPWRGLDHDAAALLTAGHNGLVGAQDCTPAQAQRPRTFVQVFRSPARMILAGANDYTRALSVAATNLGYHVTVVDARETFTTPARFPAADQVVVDWPHRYLDAEQDAGRVDDRTVVCVLTHDPKFDVPLLASALRLPEVGFIGALGSRRAHAERTDRLRAAGLDDAETGRVRSPLGLDLAADTPEETAVSILAQILADRGNTTARPLAHLNGPIHRRSN
ncbi:XdhC family protein [Nocardia alba]|uniref:Xanthine dehydrogenase accessory factor n=1 Tax=Nocardia alba TaxID=225051 RepID=A0A4V2PC39_9NOCA|nr:XdhC/CoxI family protein [Nocardia alba]TCJ99795.1 xanthine dehydrogenase accessory factor [Nocardia alba]